jgi:hypothetical protein
MASAAYNQPVRTVHAALVVVVSACWRNTEPPPVVPSHAPNGVFTITEQGFGPIDAQTPATLIGLRQRLAGYDVKPVSDGSSLTYDVFVGGERLFYVVPDDDGTVFNVHATSDKVAVADHPWRAGKLFTQLPADLSCECWGLQDEFTACYRAREHVAVVFHRACSGLAGVDASAHRTLIGAEIERVVWSAKPFGADEDVAHWPGLTGTGTYGGDGYGSGSSTSDDLTDPWAK